MTQFEPDMYTADIKYKQTIEEFYKSKPTPSMQKLDKEINELKQAVKNAPEPLMNKDFVCEHKKQNIEKRKKQAIEEEQSNRKTELQDITQTKTTGNDS